MPVGNIDICEIFDILTELLRYKGTPHYAQVRKGEILRICLQCSKAQNELGWQPCLLLREGLSETVTYYGKNVRKWRVKEVL